jgi:DNA helicase HerA-like ATPase
MEYPIPHHAFDDRLAIVGTAGSGKTYLASTAIETILRKSHRVIVVDPLGVWYGLRLNPDGVTPSGLNPIIIGGKHGDIAIHEQAGAIIGEAVAGMAESCILDLSQLGTKAAERRFKSGACHLR